MASIVDVGFNYASVFKASPLHDAARRGDLEEVKTLIKAGTDIRETLDFWTPLHVGSKYGHADIVKELIDAGAEIDAKNADEKTSLKIAVQNRHFDCVKALLAAGANVHLRDMFGLTLLHYITKRAGHIGIMKALIAAGSDVNARTKHKWTPLHYAVETNVADFVKILLDAGADINVMDRDDRTPLYRSVCCGHTEIVKLLIAAGADIHVRRSTHRHTLLYHSAYHGDIEIAKILIAAGANINAKERTGLTTLLWCAENGLTIGDEEIGNQGTVLDESIDMSKALIKYCLFYQYDSNLKPELELDSELYQIWSQCEEQVKKMREICLGNSCSSFYKYITETNVNKLALYSSDEIFGLKSELERDNYIKMFPMYTTDIKIQFEIGIERANLLHHSQELLKKIYKTMPLEINRKITEYLSNEDLQRFLKINLIQ